MSVLIYGASDDLIEIDGDVYEEYSYDDDERATIVVISDSGGVIEVTPVFGENWTAEVKLLRPGASGEEITYNVVPRPDSPEDGDLAVEVHVKNPLVYKAVKG